MATQSVSLIAPDGSKVAALEVAPDRDRYRGTVCLDETPADVNRLFAEFEECVEGQMFTHADEVEQRIAALRLRAVFSDGGEAEVTDLQVFPGTKRASFKTRNRTAPTHPTPDDATPIKELV